MNKKAIKFNFKKKKKELTKDPKNNKENSILINKILAYSAKKIKAKPPPPYSILNPETNSDSPSAKSNGVRLVSANLEIIHINPIGKNKKKNHILSCNNSKYSKLNPPIKNNKDNNIRTKATSYEIV